MRDVSTTLTAYSLAPGGYARIDSVSIPSGAWSPTGLSGADWPTDFHNLLNGAFDPWEQVDMDQDANSGITGVPKTGAVPAVSAVHSALSGNQPLIDAINAVTQYSEPIADTSTVVPGDPSTFSTVGRASQLYYAFRVITNDTAAYSVMLDSCDQLSGTTSIRTAQRSVLGCRLTVGANSSGSCTDADTTLLNVATPAFSVGTAAFIAKRISSPPSSMVVSSACDTARRVFPTEFPPTVP